MMPAYSLAIFDFDGTLADSFPWFCSVLDQVADRFSLRRVKPEEIEDLRDLSSIEVLKHLGVPLWKVPAMSTYFRKLMADGLTGISMFPSAADALATLHRAGVRLALVSSNGEDNVRRVLGDSAVLIDRYACGSSLFGKPSKFRAVLRALQVSAGAAIAIGDEVRDIDSAREAGIAVGSVSFGYNSRKALAARGPDHLFESYGELVGTLLRTS